MQVKLEFIQLLLRKNNLTYAGKIRIYPVIVKKKQPNKLHSER